jgi:hypothetical protein
MKRLMFLCFLILCFFLIPSSAFSEGYAYCAPYYTSQEGYWTGLGLRNYDSTTIAVVDVSVFDDLGNIVATEQKSIPPNGQMAFLPGANLGKEGWIFISSSAPLFGLCFFGTNGADNYMADISLVSESSTESYFSHVAQDSTWDTTIVMCNPNDTGNLVSLSFVDSSGETIYIKDYYIPAGGSQQCALQELELNQSNWTGSVEISSTYGIAAYALFNNLKTGGRSYAGLSAALPPESDPECPTCPTCPGPQVFESVITSDFDGFDQGNLYVLQNGQIWRQTEYWNWYWYWYRPDVLVYYINGVWKLKVDDIDHAVRVERIQ